MSGDAQITTIGELLDWLADHPVKGYFPTPERWTAIDLTTLARLIYPEYTELRKGLEARKR